MPTWIGEARFAAAGPGAAISGLAGLALAGAGFGLELADLEAVDFGLADLELADLELADLELADLELADLLEVADLGIVRVHSGSGMRDRRKLHPACAARSAKWRSAELHAGINLRHRRLKLKLQGGREGAQEIHSVQVGY